jgi:hypothetical protein
MAPSLSSSLLQACEKCLVPVLSYAAIREFKDSLADLTLAAVAINQLASRDARPGRDALHAMLAAVGVQATTADMALNWLINERLVVGPNDLRTPHQRFANVVLGRTLAGQDRSKRETVGKLLNIALENPSHPLAGLRLLLDELHRLGHPYSWTHLVQPARLGRLIGRCWEAESTTDRMFAMLVLAELDGYVPGWPRSVLDGRYDVLARWFSDPEDPSGYGIGRLTNSVRAKDEALANALVGASDPERVAETVSKATAKTVYNLAEMLALTGSTRPGEWKARFQRQALRCSLLDGRNPRARHGQGVHAHGPTRACGRSRRRVPRAQRPCPACAARVGSARGVQGETPAERAEASACGRPLPATLSKQLSATGKRDSEQMAGYVNNP